MKKVLILVLVLAFVPLLSFAELGVGASAFFNSPVLIGQSVDKHELWDGGFTFGGNLRWKLLRILQLDTLALVTLDETKAIGLYADAGLGFTVHEVPANGHGAILKCVGGAQIHTEVILIGKGVVGDAGGNCRLVLFVGRQRLE